MMQKLFTILGTLLFAAIGIFILAVFLGYVLKIPSKQVRPAPQEQTSTTVQTTPTIDRKIMPVRGRDDARVTIVSYMDFSCSHCATMNERLDTLWNTSSAQLRMIWKDVPKQNDTTSLAAHTAARCAGEQGKFWEYRALLFANTEHTDARLRTNATMLGLNLPVFNTCRSRPDNEQYFAQVRNEVQALGITSTPYLFVNDTRVQGMISLDELTSIVTQSIQQ